MENSSEGPRRLTRNGGTDTPKDLAARVKIIELFTLHVLPQNGEWDYAAEFIRLSEVLDEERKEVFLQTLEELKDEKERGNQRAAELQREKEAEIERQMKEAEEKQKAAAAAEKSQKLSNGHKRASSEVDYGIDKSHPNGAAKSQPVKGADKPVQGGDNKKPKTGAATTTRRTGFPQPSSSSKGVGEREKSVSSVSRRIRFFYNLVRNMFQQIQHSVAGNPMAFIRTILFTLGFLLALSRQDVRARIQRLTNSSWQKIRGTVGMGMKVSYI
jgi:solute carrier family 10 (sodium/bile acid cotransporter), member 7